MHAQKVRRNGAMIECLEIAHELEQLHEGDKAVVIPIYHGKHAKIVTHSNASGIISLTRSLLQ